MSGAVRGFYAALGVELPVHAGANVQARCFANPDGHRNGDRTPSCSVSIESGAFRCHGCGAKGGPYDAALALGRSRADAAELAKRHDLFATDREQMNPGAAKSGQ